MKIPPRAIDSFLKKPDTVARVVLLYGPDAGLVAERAHILAKTFLSDTTDPFAVVTLSGSLIAEDPARLADEAASIPMLGGPRLVRVSEATDSITPALKAYLAAPTACALIIIESGNLSPSSPLRKLCEASATAAALACYVEEGGDLTRTISVLLAEHNARAEPDALAFLVDVIGGDRARVRAEVEKLTLYHGAQAGPITLTEAKAVMGDSATVALDDLSYAITAHLPAQALTLHARLAAEGTAPVFVLRVVQAHFRRLHLAKERLAAGEDMEALLKSMRIFFKQAPAFRKALSSWPAPRLLEAAQRLAHLEARCKTSGQADPDLLIAQALLALAR